MQDRSSKPANRTNNRGKGKPDTNMLAFDVVQQATGQAEKPVEKQKNPAAMSLGRLGGLKGGKARANTLTPEKRREIAKKAADTRWGRS